MPAFMFVTRPENNPQSVRKAKSPWWSCGKATRAGDRLFVYTAEGIGVACEWRATSDARRDRKSDYRCNIAWVRQVSPTIGLGELKDAIPRETWAAPHLQFRGYSAIQIPPGAEDILDNLRPSTNLRSGVAPKLSSTRHHGPGIEPLSAEMLAGHLAEADDIRIASAFYDLPALKLLLQGHRKTRKRKVEVLLNGLGGERLEEQKKELEDLAEYLARRGDVAEIRLVFEPSLFHSKLILARRRGVLSGWVGSANATTAALGEPLNEEILVRFEKGASALLGYFETVFRDRNTTKRLSEIDAEHAAKSLVAFFRAGTLFFKPTIALQKTFNPFTELLGALPTDQRARFDRVPIDYADAAGGIGPFNIVRGIRDLRLGPMGEEQEEAEALRVRANIRPFAVETCFGYWVPAAYVPLANGVIERAGARKESEYAALLEELQETGWDSLAGRYGKYLASVERLLEELKINWRTPLEQRRKRAGAYAWTVADPFNSLDAFRRFYDRTMSNLTKHRRRLSSPFLDEPMPEIWTDPVASESFATSFFEFLEYAAQRPQRPRAAGAILEACAGGSSAAELREALSRVLRQSGWRRSDWPDRQVPPP